MIQLIIAITAKDINVCCIQVKIRFIYPLLLSLLKNYIINQGDVFLQIR